MNTSTSYLKKIILISKDAGTAFATELRDLRKHIKHSGRKKNATLITSLKLTLRRVLVVKE